MKGQVAPVPRGYPLASGENRIETSRTVHNGRVPAQEAFYSGVHFRSTLEARWAVFFDVLGRSWDYEPAEYPVCQGHNYIPDIYVLGLGWVEVKGPPFLSAASFAKIGAAAAGPRPLPSREPVLGDDGAAHYVAPGSVILLGDVPEPRANRRPVHSMVLAEPSLPGKAEVWRVVLGRSGVPELIDDRPVRLIDASGVIKSRGPAMDLRKALCNPEPVEASRYGKTPGDVAHAYSMARELRVVGPRDRTSPVTTKGHWAGRPL